MDLIVITNQKLNKIILLIQIILLKYVIFHAWNVKIKVIYVLYAIQTIIIFMDIKMVRAFQILYLNMD
jgi:hypothetical protein